MLAQDPKLIPMRQELFLSALILDSGRVGRDCMLGSRISSRVAQGRLLITSHAACAGSEQASAEVWLPGKPKGRLRHAGALTVIAGS